jgi:hypothetical protein
MLLDRRKTSFNLSVKALGVVTFLSEEFSLSKTAVIETALREMLDKRFPSRNEVLQNGTVRILPLREAKNP